MTVDDQSKPFTTSTQTVFIVSTNEHWDTQASDVAFTCGMRCVSVSSIATFLDAAGELDGPACALIDLETPGIDWSSLHEQMLQRDLKVPIVVVADEAQLMNAIEAVKSCVNFVIARPIDASSIREMILAAVESQKVVRHQFAVEQHYRRLLTLDDRERSIVDLAVDGAPNKQIANRLGLSVKTIERIRKNAYQKLDVRSTAEMTRAVILGNLHDIVYPLQQPILANAFSSQ